MINPFQTSSPFLYPLKISEIFWSVNVFEANRKKRHSLKCPISSSEKSDWVRILKIYFQTSIYFLSQKKKKMPLFD